jgi:hypothetical protein
MIPKTSSEDGMGISWPAKKADLDKLKQLHEALKAKM